MNKQFFQFKLDKIKSCLPIFINVQNCQFHVLLFVSYYSSQINTYQFIIQEDSERYPTQTFRNIQEITLNDILQLARLQFPRLDIALREAQRNDNVDEVFVFHGMNNNRESYNQEYSVNSSLIDSMGMMKQQKQQSENKIDYSVSYYINWRTEQIKIGFMDRVQVTIPIYQQGFKMRTLLIKAQRYIRETLNLKSNPKFRGLYCGKKQSLNKRINLDIKFYQYRKAYPKMKQCEIELEVDDDQLNYSEYHKDLKKFMLDQGVDPNIFTCPITLELFRNPCYLAKCRHYFEQVAIQVMLMNDNRCPACRSIVSKQDVILDHILGGAISHLGVEMKAKRQGKKRQVSNELFTPLITFGQSSPKGYTNWIQTLHKLKKEGSKICPIQQWSIEEELKQKQSQNQLQQNYISAYQYYQPQQYGYQNYPTYQFSNIQSYQPPNFSPYQQFNFQGYFQPNQIMPPTFPQQYQPQYQQYQNTQLPPFQPPSVTESQYSQIQGQFPLINQPNYSCDYSNQSSQNFKQNKNSKRNQSWCNEEQRSKSKKYYQQKK